MATWRETHHACRSEESRRSRTREEGPELTRPDSSRDTSGNPKRLQSRGGRRILVPHAVAGDESQTYPHDGKRKTQQEKQAETDVRSAL